MHTIKHSPNHTTDYIGITRFTLDTLCALPKDVTREPLPHNPYLVAIVQNEDTFDMWVLDPKDRVAAMQTLADYYRNEEPWVINNPRGYNIRVFSWSPEITF